MCFQLKMAQKNQLQWYYALAKLAFGFNPSQFGQIHLCNNSEMIREASAYSDRDFLTLPSLKLINAKLNISKEDNSFKQAILVPSFSWLSRRLTFYMLRRVESEMMIIIIFFFLRVLHSLGVTSVWICGDAHSWENCDIMFSHTWMLQLYKLPKRLLL